MNYWRYVKFVIAITFDPAKRDWTLHERGLDFADAAEVFTGGIPPSSSSATERSASFRRATCGAGWW